VQNRGVSLSICVCIFRLTRKKVLQRHNIGRKSIPAVAMLFFEARSPEQGGLKTIYLG